MTKFNKDAVRSASKRFVADLTGIIYNGLVHQVPKNRTLKTIKSEIAWFGEKTGGISYLGVHKLWTTCVKAYQDTFKTAYLSLRKSSNSINYQEKLKMRSNGVFDALKAKVIDTSIINQAVNFIVNEKEASNKTKNIDEMLDSAREAGTYSPFYLSDSHKNCAKDHLEYESRIYFDEKYANYVSDPELLEKIEAYIRNHKCLAVQEVIGYPHYFLTRPNCRHQIVPVPVEEVLSSSVKKMQIRRKLVVDNARVSHEESVSRAYYNKYLEYKALWDVAPNEKIAQEMKRSKQLYRKWARLAGKR